MTLDPVTPVPVAPADAPAVPVAREDPPTPGAPGSGEFVPWATVADVRARWSDAPLNDVLLGQWITAAHEQTYAYAPASKRDLPRDQVPQGFVEAECLVVRNIWQDMLRDGDVIGFGDGFAVRVRPLDAAVKQKLRPKRGVPVIG